VPILHRVGHRRIRQCRDPPATAAPASRCAAAVRHGYGSSPAAASRVRVVVGRREQLAFQGRVVELRGFRPGDADHRRATMYSAIAVRPMPSDRENTRALAPHGYFRRRTSGIFCIDNPSAALAPPPCANRKGRTLPPQIAGSVLRLTLSTGWPLSLGIGDRLPSDSARVPVRTRSTMILYLSLFKFPQG
jgi:hypothetical protein